MSRWLEPVRRALDARTSPVVVFCRDDDAGWEDARLACLLDVFSERSVPLDLAVIPSRASAARASWLLARQHVHRGRLGVHQHGWAHRNHELRGRKCEFGSARPIDALISDLVRGREAMAQAFGAKCDTIFTPPWNRCVPELGPVLVALGFTVLSRDHSALPMGRRGLHECPTHVDWSSRRHGTPPDPCAIAAAMARVVATEDVVGLLFHHAAMAEDDLIRAGALLDELTRHEAVQLMPLVDAAMRLASDRRPTPRVGRSAAS